MRFDILSIFPAMFDSYFEESILKRAREAGHIEIAAHDIREFATDKHHKTDDTPYGGGAGMVMKVEPIARAVENIAGSREQGVRNKEQGMDNEQVIMLNKGEIRVILLSAKGRIFTQREAKRLSKYDRLILICGRYEGVDERVAKYIADEELSIGEYVLSGGELAAMVVVDAVSRLVPGVLGNVESVRDESHEEAGYLEYPHYTKPENFRGWSVPTDLLSGNHADIASWRRQHASRIDTILPIQNP